LRQAVAENEEQKSIGINAMHPDNDTRLSIIVPVLNEAENIQPLLQRIVAVQEAQNIFAEIVIVDGGSQDGTQGLVDEICQQYPWVGLIQSDGRQGLAGDVYTGAAHAVGDIAVVLDADFSHTPETIPDLIQPLLQGSADMVLGSRYVRGGGTPDWSCARRLISRVATLCARPLVNAQDPMSGFFAVRRELLLQLGKNASGFKIALELLAQGGDSLRVQEVPILFCERKWGHSKLGMSETLAYGQQLLVLSGGSVSTGHGLRFACVGLLGLILDAAVFNVLLLLGLGLTGAHILSFAAATLSNYTLNARWSFADTAGLSHEPSWLRYARYFLVCIMALFLRGAVISALVQGAQWPPQAAIFGGIAAATLVNFVGTAFFIFPTRFVRKNTAIRWRVFGLCIIAYAVVLRLAFSGVIDLIPEEAYYWQYSQHLDLGYLDHPPMVSWLIGLSTSLLGKSEFAVRLPALICWSGAAFFMFHLARNLFGTTSAYLTVVLMAVLPIYFGIGTIMTPDAPLYAAWAGSLYFLERALMAQKTKAWWGVGVCLGLGMLSKYTIALLGPSIFVFLLLDKNSRHWLTRPEPYFATVLALVLFSPVILWNATHGWASFAFQGTRRWSGDPEFSLHVLIGSVLVLLTPVGFVAALSALLPKGWTKTLLAFRHPDQNQRIYLFMHVYTFIPLSVFILHSLQGDPKLNWTGPVWLAVLPCMAWIMSHTPQGTEKTVGFLQRLPWRSTAVGLLLLYGGVMYYILLGFPGLAPVKEMPLPAAWEEMGQRVEQLAGTIQTQGQDRLLIAGMDKYFISSQISFYDRPENGSMDISGQHLVGGNSLMWSKWQPAKSAWGKNILMLSFEREELEKASIATHFAALGKIQKQPVLKKSKTVTHFYYRIGYQYTG
jgi:dolichol-phosphate mannosyltransferase